MFGLDWMGGWAALWLVPVMGVVVCGAAFLVGRRMLASSRENSEVPEVFDHEFLQGVTQDRRSAPRRKGNAVAVQILVGNDPEPVSGWVLDRSIGGLCLLAERPLPETSAIKVRPAKASTQIPWAEATVKSCRREGTLFELGCQFHRTPNWNLLVQFG